MPEYSDEELQAKIDEAVSKATDGLSRKKDELLSEVKKLKKGREIDPNDVVELETENEKLRTDLAASMKELKTVSKSLETAEGAFKSESGFTRQMLIESGLNAELMKNGVTNPVRLKAVASMLKGSVDVVVDGENRSAMAGDKTLADYVKEWAGSDEGKHFVDAPNNSGGNAQGGTNESGSKTISRVDFDGKGHADKANMMKEGYTVTE